MSRPSQPLLPLPESLRAAEIGTFTEKSVAVRLPTIGRRVLAENDFPPGIRREYETFIDEIPHAPMPLIDDPGAPDEADWKRYGAQYAGLNWLEVPWFYSEFYFYRRILQITGYFRSDGLTGFDPYTYQKQQGLETAVDSIRALCDNLRLWLYPDTNHADVLARLLSIDLWGNQKDLSLWPADDDDKPDHADAEIQQEHLLVDHTTQVVDHLLNLESPRRVDFLIDNAGVEFVSDLALADYLLNAEIALMVRLHVKAHPVLVSDVIIPDVEKTLAYLESDPVEPVRQLAGRIRAHLAADRLAVGDHFFWDSPLPMWEMPPELFDELAASQLVIAKGDANYRRLLHDRHWAFTTPFEDIVAYFPAPLVALRTHKSEVAAGLTESQIAALDARDPDWRFDGLWGVIQFAP
ncbi:MAG: protein-glutamate O-methyltransferase family protein [Anaerolineae bacterium]|nr:protein-glutamate O-methyltransferase family protein [Anaerolineae bacterium]